MEILAIIPARGGSKGIPGKNLRIVGGASLVARSVSIALNSKSVSRVVVSTDDDAIALEAERSGAEVCRRPAEISDDEAASEAALLHTLNIMKTEQNYEPDVTVFLQCTAPLTHSDDIDGTVRALLDNSADAAFAAVDFHQFLWTREEDGGWHGINHDQTVRQMRQDRPEEVLEAGAVYAMRTDSFLESGHRFCGELAVWKMPRSRFLEIDEPDELAIAEALTGIVTDESRGIPFRPEALIFDFDGVLTDNRVWLDKSGDEQVSCHRGDGMGIEMLRNTGLAILILSKETDGVVAARARKLGVEVIQSCNEKLSALQEWAKDKGIPLGKIIYAGNDVNDAACMKAVGYAIMPADGHPDIKNTANYVTHASGGFGVAREIADLIIPYMENTE